MNHSLRVSASSVTVVAFLIYPAANTGFNAASLQGHAMAKALQVLLVVVVTVMVMCLQETVAEVRARVGRRVYEVCCRGEVPTTETTLLDPEDRVKLKRVVLASARSAWPPVTTHTLADEAGDPVLAALRRCNLLNSPEDRVKVVFHPDFLNQDNPLLGLGYEEFVRGCHLGVFPSYYEPWGYTPAECAALGVPSVTTNLSGFGCFIQEHVAEPRAYGVFVLDRKEQGVEDTVVSLASHLFHFTGLGARQRNLLRSRVERLSELLDWEGLSTCYTQVLHLHVRLKCHGAQC